MKRVARKASSMRSGAWALCLLGALVLAAGAVFPGSAAADPHGHWRGGVSVTVSPFWWGPWWGVPGPYYGYYGPWYYDYPRTVVTEPPVYVEPPQETPAPPTTGYWYYCPSARGYYPTVQSCPEPWVKVPPRPE